MSVVEDNERGVLEVSINYIKVAQTIKATRHMLDKLEAQLEVAAAQKNLNKINQTG